MKLLPSILQIIRLQLPQDPRMRDVYGHYPLGGVVHIASSAKHGLVIAGRIESREGDNYDIRLLDGSKEFRVPESRIAYSSLPLFSLSATVPVLDAPSSAVSAPSAEGDSPQLGTSAHLLSLLKYLVWQRTVDRIGKLVAEDELQRIAEQLLAILTVTLLHISLGPLDKSLFHDTVADIHDTITSSDEKCRWLTSSDWLNIASWCKNVLPLPEPEVEVEPVHVDDSHLAFRK